MQGRSKKILIVEDEARLAEVLSDMLGDQGYTITVARDGEQGLAAALEQKPDLILLDILLPKKEGLDMLAQLREHADGAHTKVMVLSNLSDTASVNKAMQHGAFDFYVKSNWDIDALVEEIKAKLA
jgi:DNA-binding response OmpR family regulator